jgi:hypothetical protein
MIASILALAAAVQQPGPASVHDEAVEKRLAGIVGDWTIEGQAKTFRNKCDWYAGRAFVICNAEDKKTGARSQSVFGYSKVRGRFTYQYFDSNGVSFLELGFPVGDEDIVFTDERPTGTGVARVQSTISRDELGELRFSQYRSVNGGPWVLSAQIDYAPAKPPARSRRRR